jgi:hypothetical protein
MLCKGERSLLCSVTVDFALRSRYEQPKGRRLFAPPATRDDCPTMEHTGSLSRPRLVGSSRRICASATCGSSTTANKPPFSFSLDHVRSQPGWKLGTARPRTVVAQRLADEEAPYNWHGAGRGPDELRASPAGERTGSPVGSAASSRARLGASIASRDQRRPLARRCEDVDALGSDAAPSEELEHAWP